MLRKKDKLKGYLDTIDDEVAGNFSIFASQENPDVRFPYTRVSVNEIGKTVKPDQKLPETQSRRKIWVIFTPFSPPPGGGPEDTANVIYDRVLTSLPEIVQRKERSAKDVEVYALGLPTSKWGSVSEGWLGNLKEHGFSEYGKLYAEFLRTVFPKEYHESKKANIMFFGGSMGTILADQTAKQLPEYWEYLRVLLDNPTGVHKPSLVPAKGMQVVAGFGAEVALRILGDNVVKTALSKAPSAREELNIVLQKRGIMLYESIEQDKLKKDVLLQEIKLLIKGTPLDTEDFRSYVAQGMPDAATTDIKRLIFLMTHGKNERFFKAGERSLGMGVNYSHWMDRGKWPQKWIRAIERYES